MSEWQLRHRVMFAELATRYPYGLSRDELRGKWDAHFPAWDGRTFAATLRSLEAAGLVRGHDWPRATATAVEALRLTDSLADLVGDVL